MKFVVFWTLWVRSICGFLIYLPTLLLGMAVRSLSDLLDHNMDCFGKLKKSFLLYKRLESFLCFA